MQGFFEEPCIEKEEIDAFMHAEVTLPILDSRCSDLELSAGMTACFSCS
jgi:hypothetical protein